MQTVRRNRYGQLILFGNRHQQGSILIDTGTKPGCRGIGIIGSNVKIGGFAGKLIAIGRGRIGHQEGKGRILEGVRALDLCLSKKSTQYIYIYIYI